MIKLIVSTVVGIIVGMILFSFVCKPEPTVEITDATTALAEVLNKCITDNEIEFQAIDEKNKYREYKMICFIQEEFKEKA